MNFIFATDLHGIEQDKKAVAAFHRFTKSFDPLHKALRVFGGDLWNLAALRRQADEHERVIRLKEDLRAGIDFLEEFRPSVFIRGNHDQRLWDSVKRERVNRTGWLSELAQEYIVQVDEVLARLKIRMLPYDKAKGVYKVGSLSFAHGFGSGESLTSKMAETYGDVLLGHGHRIERVSAMRSGTAVTGYQVGCLCRDNMEYTRADLGTLRQEQGFAYGVLGKRAEVFQARIERGVAIVASGIKTV